MEAVAQKVRAAIFSLSRYPALPGVGIDCRRRESEGSTDGHGPRQHHNHDESVCQVIEGRRRQPPGSRGTASGGRFLAESVQHKCNKTACIPKKSRTYSGLIIRVSVVRVGPWAPFFNGLALNCIVSPRALCGFCADPVRRRVDRPCAGTRKIVPLRRLNRYQPFAEDFNADAVLQ